MTDNTPIAVNRYAEVRSKMVIDDIEFTKVDKDGDVNWYWSCHWMEFNRVCPLFWADLEKKMKEAVDGSN